MTPAAVRKAAALAAVAGLAACVPPAASPPATIAPAPIAVTRPARLPPPPAIATAADFGLPGSARQGDLLRGTAPPGTVRLMLDGEAVAVAPDRRFVIAFDRDAPAQATLSATLADGSTRIATLAIAPRAWSIQRLATLARVLVPSADFAARRPAELARIAAARATVTDAQGWRGPFVWPATGRISGVFGSQRIYRGEPGAYHSGVDVARPVGTPVVAPAEGVVVLAATEPFTLEGRLLILDHGHGLSSAFLHLSRIDVAPGQRVRRGEAIGAIGATGRATGPHLHWGMTWRGRRIDPALLPANQEVTPS